MTLIKSTHIRPSTQSNDILHFLQLHPFVKKATRLKDNHFLLVLSISDAATEVFVQLLDATDTLVIEIAPRTLIMKLRFLSAPRQQTVSILSTISPLLSIKFPSTWNIWK
ncbi:hypothetical protein GXP67_02365 [Rhodocytophaga rosea]|uniref:Uncharacterized protein n=1 Tax=Rhodocytophaga rosea TaxID=2704465 RepID=A0A6C0GCA7_9BACT|nr:hypothetical protein [Rhodocytophaga rosea]QHT65586.1 hypothetical protein GXP67_02365 [Rhodocytophaga rosea]